VKKIYFAPTNIPTEQYIKEFSLQTPSSKGIWNNITYTKIIEDADYLIIQDYTSDENLINKFEKKNIIYFNREVLDKKNFYKYKKKKFTIFSFWDKSGYLFSKWIYTKPLKKFSINNLYNYIFSKFQSYEGLKKNYDQIKIDSHKEKRKTLCCVLTNKKYTEGHKIRINFTKQFIKKFSFNLYGSIKFKNSDIKKYNNSKYKLLKNYKYCLGFDNQDHISNFFGTQFTDAILCLCVPIFWCGTNLEKFFPKNSFIQFDARKPEIEIPRIIEILNKDNYNRRLPDLKRARDLILNKYNFWPTVESIISKNK
jgi:hypothetical protein